MEHLLLFDSSPFISGHVPMYVVLLTWRQRKHQFNTHQIQGSDLELIIAAGKASNAGDILEQIEQGQKKKTHKAQDGQL